jgi:hypothetical protein
MSNLFILPYKGGGGLIEAIDYNYTNQSLGHLNSWTFKNLWMRVIEISKSHMGQFSSTSLCICTFHAFKAIGLWHNTQMKPTSFFVQFFLQTSLHLML